MHRILVLIVVAGMTLALTSTGWAATPGPPVEQTIGRYDGLFGVLVEADCRICHDSGVPDRHHMLYPTYTCLQCHGATFDVERDCTVCHTSAPHHSTQDAVDRHCTACHGDIVDDYDDGHYIPTYSPSLVTPWRGLNGDGYENAPYPTEDLTSDGSGSVVPADFTTTEAGPPFFTVTAIGPLGTTHTRNEPAKLKFKPSGTNNDIFIGSTHHGGEQYSVLFQSGSPMAASWDAGTQTLTVTLDTTQTAAALVAAINTATGGVDVEAELGYDGEDPVADRLADTHYEPIGGLPANSRGFGAGSCSYCHDNDGNLDANGDPMGPIWDNHTLHHEVIGSLPGGYPGRCNICHDYATTSEQSGPNFNSAIRVCEQCHGPDSLHNIQADSPADPTGTVVIGGEDYGYGHVGRDAGPGDSDCWGCHGFSVASMAPGSGPLIPTIYGADVASMNAGTDTMVVLSGASFTNYAGDDLFESSVALTSDDGSSVTLTPDLMDQGTIVVTIPGDTAPGNYNLQAVKDEFKSNPASLTIAPKVAITKAISDGSVTIRGSGFGGYMEGSGTMVTTTGAGKSKGRGRRKSTTEVATIVSWTDTKIVADFASSPEEVTVYSVFGEATSEVSAKPSNGKNQGKRQRK